MIGLVVLIIKWYSTTVYFSIDPGDLLTIDLSTSSYSTTFTMVVHAVEIRHFTRKNISREEIRNWTFMHLFSTKKYPLGHFGITRTFILCCVWCVWLNMTTYWVWDSWKCGIHVILSNKLLVNFILKFVYLFFVQILKYKFKFMGWNWLWAGSCLIKISRNFLESF